MAVLPEKPDCTTIFMKIKECIKPIRNARILTCMLNFRIGLRLAIGHDLLFLRQLLISR